ncbi:hypothetical protein [Helicobacter sp. MIT 03-1614]|uniref:hypothetical protein n=1 Tax=Helicobacter sp. MIT 03-1614 TaxID=1548147 RepID=UPI001F1A8D12|nr:hypothetical protein [Helicobacter sp. MIT 03-1614]
MQFGKVDIYLCTCFNLLLHFCILKFKYNLIFLLFKQKSGGGGVELTRIINAKSIL